VTVASSLDSSITVKNLSMLAIDGFLLQSDSSHRAALTIQHDPISE
jgi:hypothetical protein